MKKIALALIGIVLGLGGFAQTKPVNVPLDKRSDISEIVSLGEQGFVIKTAIGYAGREKNIQIHSFTNDMRKRWTVKLEKPTNTMLNYTLLASPFSSYVYYIQMSKVFTAQKGVMNIARIDSAGKKKDIVYKVSKEFENSEKVALFADDDALYFLNYDQKVNRDKDVKKGKANKKENRLVVFVLDNNKTVMERHETDIRISSDSKDADLFIEYLGHDDENIYLSKKTVDLGENTIKYEVFTLNKSFVTQDVTEFEAKIEAPIVPAVNSRNYNGAEIYNNDYDVEISHRGNTTVTTYIANAGSFGCAYLDVAHGNFYIYGLSGLKPLSKDKKKSKSSKLNTDAKGGYVLKFDFGTGDLLEQKEFELPKEMLADKMFADPYLFVNRTIWLDVVGDHTYRLCGVGYNEKIHIALVSESGKKAVYLGKKIDYRKSSGLYHRRFLANALGDKTYLNDDYMKFIKKYPEFRMKDYSVFGIYLGDRTIVVRNTAFTREPKLELNMFLHKGTGAAN